MKHFISAALAVAISILPRGAVAGEPTAPVPPDGPMPPFGMAARVDLTPSQQQAWEQIMQQTHQQMEQLHAQARTKVLAALRPAHRSLLAQVVGSLAIAPNPDPAGAVRQLNAALSPAEAQAVISTHNAAMAQMDKIMQSAHQRMQALLTDQQRSGTEIHTFNGKAPGNQMYGMHGMSAPTAGDILLHLASPEGEAHGFMIRTEVHTQHAM